MNIPDYYEDLKMPQKIEANGKYLHLISLEELERFAAGSDGKKRQKARKELQRRGKPYNG
jgi:hypothetical protein